MKEADKIDLEGAKAELKAAFRSVAKEAGFRLKGTHALRHRNGAQQRLSLYRARNLYVVDMVVRLDLPGDKGEEVLSRWHIGTSTAYFVDSPEDLVIHDLAMKLDRTPPAEGRGPALERFLRQALPWFDEVSNREALERFGQDNEYRLRTHGLVQRTFYEDFGIRLPEWWGKER